MNEIKIPKDHEVIVDKEKGTVRFEPKDILVPDEIKLWRRYSDHKSENLLIGFGNSNQVLGSNSGCYIVDLLPFADVFRKVRCKLVPCKRKDLKAGDTAFVATRDSITAHFLLSNYCKILSNDKFAFVINNECICVASFRLESDWYKVVPIKE